MNITKRALILLVIGFGGFLGMTLFQTNSGDEWVKECQQAVIKDSGENSKSLQEQCSDRAFAIMMKETQSGTSDAKTLSSKIAASNQAEVGGDMLKLFFLGLGVVGVIGFIGGTLKEKKSPEKNSEESHQEKS